MKKKVISDIRLYKSDTIDALGYSFGDKKLNAIVRRVVMKLRENKFSFGDFDHLYINFTPCSLPGRMYLSDKANPYSPWFRCCAVQLEEDVYHNLGAPETYDDIIRRIGDILVAYFTAEDFDEARILSCVRQAAEEGEEMLMKVKEKASAKRKAVIYLRFLDTCKYCPLLRVYDLEEHLLFEKDLPETMTLDDLGELQVSTKRVAIKPRKNAYTTKSVPLVFEY